VKVRKPFLHKMKIKVGPITDDTVDISAAYVLASLRRELEGWSVEVPQKIIDAQIDDAVNWCLRDLWRNIWVEFIHGEIQVSHLCNWFQDDPLRVLHFSLFDLVREHVDHAADTGQSQEWLPQAERELTRCLRLVQERRNRLKK
jgi:hypothetical protein